jgi:predicted DNA-binding transcriptional regulator YafY
LREALLARPTGLTLAELATIVNVSTRSVRRYLPELERTLELESVTPVPGGANVWRMRPGEKGRALVLRRTQAYALLATRDLFSPLKGSALFDEVEVSFRDLRVLAERPTKKKTRGEVSPDARIEERFMFLSSVTRQTGDRADVIDQTFLAIAEGHGVSIELTPLGQQGLPNGAALNQPARRAFAPYAMLVVDGAIHVVGALDGTPSVVDAIPIEEIVEVRVRGGVAASAPPLDLPAMVEGIFGIRRARDPEPTRVLVEFDRVAGAQVRNLRVHPSQKAAFAADGRVRLSFVTGRLERVKGWVLSFGPHARIVEPQALRDQVQQDLERALEAYR